MEDEGEEQGEDLGARDQRLVPVWRKSRGAPRGCWHEETVAGHKPGTEAVQIPSCSHHHHRLSLSPSPGHQLSVEQDKYGVLNE